MSLSLQAFLPHPMAVSTPERIRAALGGAVGIALTAFVSLAIARQFDLPTWLVAPLGASAVLVFAVPSSPLAQPWSVVGGNTVSALCGLVVCNLIPDPVVAAALAIGSAIGVMFALRCLHPPGGAMALLVVLTHTHAWSFALFCIAGTYLFHTKMAEKIRCLVAARRLHHFAMISLAVWGALLATVLIWLPVTLNQ